MNRFQGIALSILFAGCSLVHGCKGEAPNDPVPVKGKVLFTEGEGAAGVLVRFQPLDDSNKSNFPEAQTNQGGGFSLSCLKGRYQVTVVPIVGGHGATNTGPMDAGAISKDNPFRGQSWEVTVPEEGKSDLVIKVNR
jgi:hypothetical protein